MIDWDKLEPYQGNKYQSFEELCYQIAKGLYEHEGRFTSIDDSGGGDGVEFYMTLPNGDQWGWQAKFYLDPSPRLSVGNRRRHIKESLITSCQKHPHLKRWFLCTPSNFTPKNGEQSWFNDTLPKSVPENMNVELVHWGDSEFNNWIREPRFGGIRNYFFGELELTFDWFRTQVKKQIRTVQGKFNEVLHTETNVDARIHAFLGDTAFSQFIAEQVIEFEDDLEKYREAESAFNTSKLTCSDKKEDRERILREVEQIIGMPQ